ncbi:MAG: 30S ribosomal protein S18 [Candidatus Levybacteria bacterium]|nr:30S ribosomal protein S18 [Candidatus Levybacteria bacterium]
MAKRKVITRRPRKITVPKTCFFCEGKKEPWYTDVESLRRFITERGKIIGRERNGLCAKHQRHLSLAIKYSRHLALLSFIGKY